MRALIGLFILAPSLAFGQALPNINSLSVRYNSQKTSARPEGELKAQIDEVDKAIAEARKTGNAGEVRRQIAKGMVLLDKRTWTPQLDYRSSLALRGERTVIDSSMPYAMRIEQIYRPSIDLSPGLTAAVRISKRVPSARAGAVPADAPAPGRMKPVNGLANVGAPGRNLPVAGSMKIGAPVGSVSAFPARTSIASARPSSPLSSEAISSVIRS